MAQGRAPFLPREARAPESERMPADPKAAFDKKVALQKSSGVMPKVPKSLSEADLKLLYYTTSTQNSYQTKAIPESMSFADIHNIGKKDTKYFKYKPSTAPFWQRSMCRYASDYVDRALRMTQGEIYITFPVYFIIFILFVISYSSSFFKYISCHFISTLLDILYSGGGTPADKIP